MTYSLGYWFGADHSAGNHQPAAVGEMVAAMRLVLVASALLVIGMDPVEPNHFPVATHVTLLLYAGYSLALYLLRKRRLNTAGRRLATAHPRWTHWADVAWFTLLAGLSTGTHGILFGFFFAILTASFTHGFREGWRVTVVSTLLFGLEGWLTAAILSGPSFSEYGFEWNGFLLRPIYLLVLGYMIAYWGGYEIEIQEAACFSAGSLGSFQPALRRRPHLQYHAGAVARLLRR